MTDLAPAIQFAAELWSGLGGESSALGALSLEGTGALPSVFSVSDLAAASIGVAGLALSEFRAAGDGPLAPVTVDRRLAAFWFGTTIRPQGWEVPPPWDPIAGDYATADGWVRLHTNAPHHRAAALKILGMPADRAAVEHAVTRWSADGLEAAIVAAGGCAARMRPAEEWTRHHPQGRAVASEPLVHRARLGEAPLPHWPVTAERPLAGIRVLDLTRVLAGPAATRFLAAFGADVLRIDPPFWEEASLAPEMTLGKRCAHLDFRKPGELDRLRKLIAQADVLVHGYRAGALPGLGLDAAARRARNPGLVDVCLNAYGWAGPWMERRGFDSLVQMSTGIAEAGMRRLQRNRPTPLPVQALDHATGYLMAAAVLRGLTERRRTGRGSAARTSLARTALLLQQHPAAENTTAFAPETEADLAPGIEQTAWGPARRLLPPLSVAGSPLAWDHPAGMLGAAGRQPDWR